MNDEEKEKEIERNKEKFYRGGMPTWENFYSSDQILVRDVHTDLIEHVNSALSSSGRGNQATKQVVIYHQPGAGGSTTSRQILWNMKEKYRCCVVKSVTKQTTEQINQLRHYGEESQIKARPVLVLVDLDEEDTTARFCEDMIAEGQRHCSDIHSVLLICRRVSELPTKRAAGLQVFLGQHLSDREQNWFKTTSKTLIERHKNKRGCDPNTLLSFNIMKENFNPDAIANQVAMYVRDPGLTEDHRLLLKYIAFLNFFDLNFKPIPMHCFDPVFSNLQWVNSIPPSFRVLVNTTDINGMCGVIPCMRIANYLLSRPVLDAVLNYEEELGKFGFTIGEVAEELLHSKIICPYSTREYEKIFEKILGNIIKKRGFIESREKPNQFCPLITEILEKKDFDTAVDIVEKIYEITDDPMVAQQLARLHTEFHNWEKALDSIRKAIEQMPNHSYLTHTCGQIYKLRFDIFCKENRNKFGERQIEEALIIAQHAYFYFQESQKISRTDNVFPQNPAGFDGEIRLGIDILRVLHPPEAIKLCEKQSHVERYAKTERLNGQRLGCMCQFLKGLPDSVFSAIQTLEADIHSTENLTDGFNLQCDHFFTILAGGQLDSYKDEFEKLLYRSVNNNPSAEKSIRSLIDASKASDEILQVVLYNMRESLGSLKVDKIRIFLASALELLLRKVTLTVCSPDDLLNLSRTFYEQNASTNPTCKLEAHMMITTFHWPLESKKKIRTKLCPHSLFLGALQSWQKIVSKRPSKPNSADKPMFYLSKSSSFPFVVKADQVSRNNAFVFKGSVCPGGNEIDITPYAFHTENAAPIKISVLHTVRLSSLWNKSTDVVIGIGLHGPKAELLVNLSCNQMRDEVSVKQKTKTKDDKRFSRQSGLLPRPVNYTGNANYHRFGSAEQYHFAQQQYPLPPDTPYMMYPQVNPWRYPPVPQGLQGGANSQRQSYMGGYAPRSRRQ